MEIEITDYNNADLEVNSYFKEEWAELESVLKESKLCIKASDQAGKQGKPIFDPVGTNYQLKELIRKIPSWSCNVLIPEKYSFLGTDIDFEKNGMIVEAQFSNYPFLLNNILRSELFFKSNLIFKSNCSKILVIITKAGKLPASNSTLYYEQAQNQLNALCESKVFSIPVRLIGLFPKINQVNEVLYSEYSTARYSRTLKDQKNKKYIITGTKKFILNEAE
jgi:hypothetical protein